MLFGHAEFDRVGQFLQHPGWRIVRRRTSEKEQDTLRPRSHYADGMAGKGAGSLHGARVASTMMNNPMQDQSIETRRNTRGEKKPDMEACAQRLIKIDTPPWED